MPLGFCTAVKAPLILRSDLLVASRRMGCVALMVRDGAEEAPPHHEAPLILALPVVRRLAGLRHLAGPREFLRRHGLRHLTQFRLRAGVTARRSAAEPYEGVHRTARDPFPPAVHHPEQALRLGIALFGEGTEQPDRRHAVAAVIGGHAVFPGTCNGACDAQNLRGHDQAADNHWCFHAPPGPWIRRIAIYPVDIRSATGESARSSAGMPEWGWRPLRNWLVILAV